MNFLKASPKNIPATKQHRSYEYVFLTQTATYPLITTYLPAPHFPLH